MTKMSALKPQGFKGASRLLLNSPLGLQLNSIDTSTHSIESGNTLDTHYVEFYVCKIFCWLKQQSAGREAQNAGAVMCYARWNEVNKKQGEWIEAEIPEDGAKGVGVNQYGATQNSYTSPTLAQVGIDKNDSPKFRALAQLGRMLKETPRNKGANGIIITGNKRAPVMDTTPTLAELEAIEAERAKEREIAGKKIDPVENFPQGKTRDIVAREKLSQDGRPAKTGTNDPVYSWASYCEEIGLEQ